MCIRRVGVSRGPRHSRWRSREGERHTPGSGQGLPRSCRPIQAAGRFLPGSTAPSGRPSVFTNRRTGQVQWIRVGNRDHGIRLYRKDLESPGRTPHGLLRWEYQSRSRSLRKFGVSSFSTVTPDAIRSIADDRWKWSRMSASVTSANTVLSAIESLEFSRTIKARLLYDISRFAEYGELPSRYSHRVDLSNFITRYGIVVNEGHAGVPPEPALQSSALTGRQELS